MFLGGFPTTVNDELLYGPYTNTNTNAHPTYASAIDTPESTSPVSQLSTTNTPRAEAPPVKEPEVNAAAGKAPEETQEQVAKRSKYEASVVYKRPRGDRFS